MLVDVELSIQNLCGVNGSLRDSILLVFGGFGWSIESHLVPQTVQLVFDLPFRSICSTGGIDHAVLLASSKVEALWVLNGFVLDKKVDAFIDSELS